MQKGYSTSMNSASTSSVSTLASPTSPGQKYAWIRVALFEKKLVKIIDYLVLNANKFYEHDALVCDPDYGPILSSLLGEFS